MENLGLCLLLLCQTKCTLWVYLLRTVARGGVGVHWVHAHFKMKKDQRHHFYLSETVSK